MQPDDAHPRPPQPGDVTQPDDQPPPTRRLSDGETNKANRGYRLLRLLGRGGFGEVWLARAPDGHEVAVKRILVGQTVESQKERQALELVRTCVHPNLIRLEEHWEDETYLWIVMEKAERSLFDRLRSVPGQGIPLEELLGYMEQTAAALDYMHDQGIVHRDIKPANILLLRDQVKVADFGLARIVDPSRAPTYVGTEPYMAPEVLQGAAVVAASDQFSLALTYIELRTGKHPLTGLNRLQMFQAIVDGVEVSTLPLAEEQAIIRKALSGEPGQRYPNCGALAAALRDAVARLNQDNIPTVLADPVQAHRRRVLTAIVAVGLVCVFALIWLMWPKPVPAVTWLPPNGEAASHATRIAHDDSGKRLVYNRVLVKKGDQEFDFVHVPADEVSQAFYMLHAKVSRAQFRAAWDTPEYQQHLKELRERNSQSLSRFPSVQEMKSEDDHLWPQYDVNLLQAQAFAWWLHRELCSLPEDRQWLMAAGEPDRDPDKGDGPFEKWPPRTDPRYDTWIAVGIDRPWPLGKALGDKSRGGCRELAGNGCEWIATDDKNKGIDFTLPLKSASALVRSQGYRAVKPYHYGDPPGAETIDNQSPFISFRIILKIKFGVTK